MYPAINRLLIALSIAFLVLGEGTAHAGAPDEFNLLSQLPPELLRQCQACGDEDGLVGSNRNGLFIADEEREAMDGLVVGLILKHDSYVERCWRAVTATYDRQTPQGDFTGKRGSSHMRFWMAWSNHALYLLTKSPRYGPRYQDALHVLLPKVQRAMDYLTEYGPSQLSNDYKSPNRTLIIATAYELGARLLEGYSDSARVNRYLAEAHRWIDNEFVNQKLFREADGVFKENGGYDTSYQGVATRFYYYCLIQDPECTPDAFQKGEKAGTFLSKRFLPGGLIDCTYNLRSGLGNAEASPKKTDQRSCRLALLYYSILFNHPEVLSAVRDMSEENNGLPPVLITPRSARGVVGAPFSLSLGFTNAGLYELDPRFSVEAADLPPGLVLESHYDFTQSTGFATIKGTPSAPGSFQVKVTPQNQFGVNAPLFITLDIQ
jgi:hypothetical protein